MAGRLFQQFLVDVYTMIETNRLRYLLFNQKNLRSENFDNIQKAADQGDCNLADQGKRIFIPSSFTGDSKMPTGEDIDKYISAELPDKDLEPYLYEVVGDSMIHGPCGPANKANVCMIDGKCSKFFPKPFSAVTKVDDAGFHIYKRREDGRMVHKKGFDCDNKYVVPYNKDLSLRYRAHINVEWCNQTRSIKYLFKYISACEDTWRTLAFPTHYRTTSVEKLSFHLTGQQLVVYNEDDPVEEVLNRISVGKSKFVAWMEANKIYPEAKNLTYADFPSYFVWHLKTRMWKPRRRGFAIGRITYVPPSLGEVYYLRVLLNIVKGPTSFEEIKTVDGFIHETFKDACYALGLLDDDKEYIEAIKEANLTLSEDQIKSLALWEIESLLRINGSSLEFFKGMPRPDAYGCDSDVNTLISDELNYNHDEQREKHRELLAKITDEQRAVYQEILDAVNGDKGGMFFVYGFGGMGKPFFWNILGAAIRSLGEIILNVASSGIAALLLPGGRTAHSRFGIPINVHDFTICTMTKGSDQAELVQQAKLIIWDEASMMSRHCFETLDRSLRDIMGCNEPFGGKVVVFGGDFRQIQPVVTDGGRVETVLASLNSSYLWNSCKVLRLTKNMRLMAGITDSEAKELEAFSKWILDIGDGNINQPNDGEVEIDIPEDLLITKCENPIEAIVNEVYGTSFAEKRDPKLF
ncbi:PREDICTED: uncharacterized protein LOC106330933 [Brassica oleracea var. oleracea]|uniref:uncharacterized protein LOC106330933 n=1 Tax=Brassica oleracea var. oleracea TaxID=109376 RepID=UPI0006A73C50|nr:PREDICTED: uncharacterized protein LOC106330933 [Brassica oleracea var. oleracea]